ncbi:hypothetical protein FQN57_006288 [Myotisia sp. PD_48]|nr:hypothetical protein FQN57_006288 [Myotisia sp. PD_48]
MADADEKSRAEKLAAAKKRVAQLQKQKGKKTGKKSTPSAAAGSSNQETVDTDAQQSQQTQIPALPEQEAEGEKLDTQPVGGEGEEAVEPEPTVENDTDTVAIGEGEEELTSKTRSHGRHPSISVQSNMRSSSFRQGSLPAGPPATVKSPPLPSLSPDGSTAPEVFRKQAIRLEELEKENKRLEKDLEIASAKWKKSAVQLDDLREASSETVELKERLAKAEMRADEADKLKAETAALQRQISHLNTRSHRPSGSVAVPNTSDSIPSELQSQLDAKSASIESMELEISNLRARLNFQSTDSSTLEEQRIALEEKLARVEAAFERTQTQLADTKQALTRASEKAVKDGVAKTSTETLIKNLERQIEEDKQTNIEAEKKIELLEKKLQALSNLHKESEARHQQQLKDKDKFEKDTVTLRRKLITVENENLRLREERDRVRKREASGGGADETLDELEDEERSHLGRKIRELEGENFDLRRGIWKERKRELSSGQPGLEDADADETQNERRNNNQLASSATFDDVDLIGGTGGPEGRRGRSTSQQPQQQHSSFATVLSSGLAAFTGGAGVRDHDHGQPYLDKNEAFLDDDDFEEAYARAQEEEEAKKRVEWAREIKRKLNDWKGWRLDLVECRYGAQGAGVGLGEIFEA